MRRRTLLKKFLTLMSGAGALPSIFGRASGKETPDEYDPPTHLYGMGIQVDKCIGCARCMEACKTENDVPAEPFYVRTWVEEYVITIEDEVLVRTIGQDSGHRQDPADERQRLRSFFVPKLCNQCNNPPCVQVCPVEATFSTEDGVILVDSTRCIGCGYCIQACPYGARYLHPVTRTVDKCTFCYHRIRQELLPACVEACPTQARVMGDFKSASSPLNRLRRMSKTSVLKPSLNTEPKVFYTDLDGEVR